MHSIATRIGSGTARAIAHAALALALILLTCCMPFLNAWAADEAADGAPELDAPMAGSGNAEVYDGGTGNYFAADDTDSTSASGIEILRDYLWAGTSLNATDLSIGGDILAAGKDIMVSDSQVGGSIRAAGQYLSFNNIMALNNLTAAGQQVSIGGDSIVAGGVYAAAHDVAFSGSCSGGVLVGENVTINGYVDGDLSVGAQNVIVGPDAVITGTLSVASNSEPEVSAGAQVGKLDFTQIEASTEDAGAALAGLAAAGLIFSLITSILGMVVFAIAFVWLLRKPVESATLMAREHMGRIFATGAIAFVASPFVFLLLLVLGITAPIGLALLFALLTITFAAVPFSAASFARMLLPKMNRFAAAAIGGAVLGIACAIPVVGIFVSIAAFMYLIGYIIQGIWQSRDDEPVPPALKTASEPVYTTPDQPPVYTAPAQPAPYAAAPASASEGMVVVSETVSATETAAAQPPAPAPGDKQD